MSKGNTLILGARSKIAMATAYRFAMEGYNIQLAARNVDNLELDQLNIEKLYQVRVTLHEFDVLDISTHSEFISNLYPDLPEIAVCAIGYMGIQSKSELDLTTAMQVIQSNYAGPLIILGEIARHFEQRGSGTIVGISSVAGERGRASNYIYGSAKAGFTAFLSGLRNRLATKDIHVVTVIPGYVATKLTSNVNAPKILMAQPEEVGEAIFKATENRKNVIYVKPVWRMIMFMIKNIPEIIFKRTKI